MKIAILIDRLNVGGVEKIAIEQVKTLRESGVDASLIVLSRKAVVEDAFQDLLKNVPITYLDDRLPSFLRFTFKFPVFYFFSFFHISYPFLIPFVVKNNEFDYIVSHGTYTSFTAVTIRKFKKIPFSSFIWDPIGYILHKVYKNKFSLFAFFFFTAIANFLDKLIAINSDVIFVGGGAHNVYLQGIAPKIKIINIPPSVHPLNNFPGKKKNYCLVVTAWKEGKSPEFIVDLIKKMPQLHIKMAGKWLDKNYQSKFLNLLELNKIQKRVNVLGEVTEQQLSKLYKEALFILQINDDRGFGMPALEAAGHGTTFIIPEGQGVCKLFKNKIDGFYTKEKDLKQISDYITLLFKDKQLALKISKHAWETVKEKYSWEKHGEQLLSIIRKYV